MQSYDENTMFFAILRRNSRVLLVVRKLSENRPKLYFFRDHLTKIVFFIDFFEKREGIFCNPMIKLVFLKRYFSEICVVSLLLWIFLRNLAHMVYAFRSNWHLKHFESLHLYLKSKAKIMMQILVHCFSTKKWHYGWEKRNFMKLIV